MRNQFKVLVVILIINLFIIRPASSYADWNGQDDGHKQNNSNSKNNSSGNSGHSSGGSSGGNSGHSNGGNGNRNNRWHSYVGVNLTVVPDNYYYGASYYSPEDNVLVSQPIYQPIVINGITYYLNNGTYYVYNGYSYQLAEPPVTEVQQPPEIVQPPVVIDNQANVSPAAVGSDSFIINIPNTRGGYTAVIIRKSGTGYLGPQGEFYPDFPKVSQLELMYGK